ncbi:YrhB domain-containing protein [Streptomyces sp. MI02-7b]|uniref:YrhB domain-containing protein n=1 Tax=Streptomyces sp. MI02-7b TaxID=462941 RepID=UPI0029B3BBA6|nr:YrhB domain-containing protein [Streptomyces sp. MI02-7b]MDX3075629.1 YrhB domain-containing protein [Streptomyces sp. MI02-7b]
MIPMERAIALVEQVLAREEAESPHTAAPPMVVRKTRRHALGWLVFAQSAAWVRTRDSRAVFLGVGPYLVDAVDGSVHTIGYVAYRMGEWEDDYRHRVKGRPRPAAPDDLGVVAARVLAAEGRVAAMRLLRKRATHLTLGQVREYVAALNRGEEPSEDLAERAAGPRGAVPLLPVTTVMGPADPPVRPQRRGAPAMSSSSARGERGTT